MPDLVPIILFLVTGAVVCVYLYLRYRARQEVQQTVRLAIERGLELTPEALAAVGGAITTGGYGDLRKGVIWLSLAAALALMSWTVDEPDLLGPTALPLMLGLAYLLLWAIGRRAE